MTEDELFRRIHMLVMGTDVTYKQVDSDLDEEGDVTIFFSNLQSADHGSDDDELVLFDYEKGYLTAFYETDPDIQKDHADRGEDNLWYGIQVGERMFDLCVWKDDDIVCVVYECFLNDGGFWNTDTSKKWFLK
jgi:hypothetical protein